MTRSAELRFYSELNDFLSPDLRRRPVRYEFSGTPAVKDAIEALGIPHPEVDLIVTGGESVGFDHRLSPGERIAVYPAFSSLDLAPLLRLRPAPPERPAFILDVHLGKPARWLRMLGFDCLYRNDYYDREIIRIALREDRTILTRDRGLLKNSAVRRGYWVRGEEPEAQVREVLKKFDLADRTRPFSRCLSCNGLLAAVPRERVLDRLPPRTRKEHHRFRICSACGKIYWSGSHHRAMEERIARLLD
jgi:uncharacterized protein